MARLPRILRALVVLALAIDHRLFWRRFVAGARAEPGRARLTLWHSWIVMRWVLAVAAVGLWYLGGRSWRELGLQMPTGWRLWVSVTLVAAVTALHAPTLARLVR